MYFMGPNTFREPWHLPYSPPNAIIEIVYEDAFNRFIDEINSIAAYDWWEGSVHSILSVLAYPCAWSWKQWHRRNKVHRLQEYVKSEYDHSCLRSCRSRALYKGMKIQDYRNCLFQRGGMGTTATSPIIHKLILKMCMENVLKDISSTLNECWTYEALLEVESRILKALQPDLQLNPKLISHSALPCKKESPAGVRSTTGNPQPHPISNAELNFYLQRFNKLGRVTKRYKLNDRKKKSGSCIQRKTFLWTPLVSQHLADLDDNDNAGTVTSMSRYSLSQELETSKSRTLTFVHQSCVRQRNDNTQFDSGNQIKLVLSEIMNEGKVEVTVLYGVEESDYTSMTFPSVGLAEQYVAQFKSLMEKEGYCITEDPIEPVAANSIGNELSMPYQTFEGSTSNSPAMADRIPNH